MEVDKSQGGPPPPSPLTGCYLLIVIGEPHSGEHKDIILQKVAKGLLSWNVSDCLVDLEKELSIITEQGLDGEEARYGERLIQFASENLVTEILIHPAVSTLSQCVRNLLSSFTRHRHIIHAGYTFQGNGSWALQDGTFSYSDFCEAFQEIEVQRVIHAYENGISIDLHCSVEGEWMKLNKEFFTKACKIRVNPTDVLNTGSPSITSFIKYLEPFLVPSILEDILESSDVVGNIRFSRPTLYVFPGGQGDAALFGINGFNMLLDGGYSRKACFWDFVRHLDRLDAVLMTRLNNSSVSGVSSILKRKKQGAVYPQLGHFFCNLPERKSLLSPDGDKDRDPLILSLLEEGQNIVQDLHHLHLNPQPCYREADPIILYHKVGHGTLNMYVLSPDKNSREVREFLQKWTLNDQKLFLGKSGKEFQFPIQNMVSICALLVWQPANPNDTVTRILYPGSTPQRKIFEGLDRMKSLEYMKTPVCTVKQVLPQKKTNKLDIIEKMKEIKKVDNKEETIKNGEMNGDVNKSIKKVDSIDNEKKVENGKPKPPAKPTNRSDSQQRKKPMAPKAPSTPKNTIQESDVKKTLKSSPTATPAKSTKDANNRKVIENKKVKKEATPPKVEAKPKFERKPISRRPKQLKGPPSPMKKMSNGVQKPDSLSRRGKLDKEGTTDSSTVSTPSADQDSILKKDLTKLTADELQQLKDKELEELKEEQEAVKEIEAVFRKGEELPPQQPSEPGVRKIKEISIDDNMDTEEYLIVEKEELEHDSVDQENLEMQKLLRDSEESEKQRKLAEEDIKKVKDVIESLPEEKVSANVESGATTTAPTLPEDERITLDEIKEDNQIEEKHAKEETKEKELPIIELPPKSIQEAKPPRGIVLEKQKPMRDIVKTPDEVADLPMHEEADLNEFQDEKKSNELEICTRSKKNTERQVEDEAVIAKTEDVEKSDILEKADVETKEKLEETVEDEWVVVTKDKSPENAMEAEEHVDESYLDLDKLHKEDEVDVSVEQDKVDIKALIEEADIKSNKKPVDESEKKLVLSSDKENIPKPDVEVIQKDNIVEDNAELDCPVKDSQKPEIGQKNEVKMETEKKTEGEVGSAGIDSKIELIQQSESKLEVEKKITDDKISMETKIKTEELDERKEDEMIVHKTDNIVEKEVCGKEELDDGKRDQGPNFKEDTNVGGDTVTYEKSPTSQTIETDSKIENDFDSRMKTEMNGAGHSFDSTSQIKSEFKQESKILASKDTTTDLKLETTLKTEETSVVDHLHGDDKDDKKIESRTIDTKLEDGKQIENELESGRIAVTPGKEGGVDLSSEKVIDGKDDASFEPCQETGSVAITEKEPENNANLQLSAKSDHDPKIDLKGQEDKIDHDMPKQEHEDQSRLIIEKATNLEADQKISSYVLEEVPQPKDAPEIHHKTESDLKVGDQKISEPDKVLIEEKKDTHDQKTEIPTKVDSQNKKGDVVPETITSAENEKNIVDQLSEATPETYPSSEADSKVQTDDKDSSTGEKKETTSEKGQKSDGTGVKEEENIKQVTDEIEEKDLVKSSIDAAQDDKKLIDADHEIDTGSSLHSMDSHALEGALKDVDIKTHDLQMEAEQSESIKSLEADASKSAGVESSLFDQTTIQAEDQSSIGKDLEQKKSNGKIEKVDERSSSPKENQESVSKKHFEDTQAITDTHLTDQEVLTSDKADTKTPDMPEPYHITEKTDDKIVADHKHGELSRTEIDGETNGIITTDPKDSANIREIGNEQKMSVENASETKQTEIETEAEHLSGSGSIETIQNIGKGESKIFNETAKEKDDEDELCKMKETKDELTTIDDKIKELKKDVKELVEESSKADVKDSSSIDEHSTIVLKEDTKKIERLDEKLSELKGQRGEKDVILEQSTRSPEHAEQVIISDSSPEEDQIPQILDLELDKMELGRKSPAEREEDVIKIVASVAEVLKSEAPLEEFSFTQELRETHITTQSPIIEAKIIKTDDIPTILEEPHLEEDLGTVHRMLVTASSEDGGEEIEICPPGTITFSKSSESSGRSSPEPSLKTSNKSSIVETVTDPPCTVKQNEELVDEKLKDLPMQKVDAKSDKSPTVLPVSSALKESAKESSDVTELEYPKTENSIQDVKAIDQKVSDITASSKVVSSSRLQESSRVSTPEHHDQSPNLSNEVSREPTPDPQIINQKEMNGHDLEKDHTSRESTPKTKQTAAALDHIHSPDAAKDPVVDGEPVSVRYEKHVATIDASSKSEAEAVCTSIVAHLEDTKVEDGALNDSIESSPGSLESIRNTTGFADKEGKNDISDLTHATDAKSEITTEELTLKPTEMKPCVTEHTKQSTTEEATTPLRTMEVTSDTVSPKSKPEPVEAKTDEISTEVKKQETLDSDKAITSISETSSIKITPGSKESKFDLSKTTDKAEDSEISTEVKVLEKASKQDTTEVITDSTESSNDKMNISMKEVEPENKQEITAEAIPKKPECIEIKTDLSAEQQQDTSKHVELILDTKPQAFGKSITESAELSHSNQLTESQIDQNITNKSEDKEYDNKKDSHDHTSIQKVPTPELTEPKSDQNIATEFKEMGKSDYKEVPADVESTSETKSVSSLETTRQDQIQETIKESGKVKEIETKSNISSTGSTPEPALSKLESTESSGPVKELPKDPVDMSQEQSESCLRKSSSGSSQQPISVESIMSQSVLKEKDGYHVDINLEEKAETTGHQNGLTDTSPSTYEKETEYQKSDVSTSSEKEVLTPKEVRMSDKQKEDLKDSTEIEQKEFSLGDSKPENGLKETISSSESHTGQNDKITLSESHSEKSSTDPERQSIPNTCAADVITDIQEKSISESPDLMNQHSKVEIKKDEHTDQTTEMIESVEKTILSSESVLTSEKKSEDIIEKTEKIVESTVSSLAKEAKSVLKSIWADSSHIEDEFKVDKDTLEKEKKQIDEEVQKVEKTYEQLTLLADNVAFEKCHSKSDTEEAIDSNKLDHFKNDKPVYPEPTTSVLNSGSLDLSKATGDTRDEKAIKEKCEKESMEKTNLEVASDQKKISISEITLKTDIQSFLDNERSDSCDITDAKVYIEAQETDDEDLSTKSQIAHSDLEELDMKMDTMSMSFYGALPEEASLAPTHLYELTKAKYDVGARQEDAVDSWGKPLGLPSPDPMLQSVYNPMTQSVYFDSDDPIASWGKPLGLPSPAPPNNQGTPKKERKLPAHVTAKNKLNDDKKRADSPSKLKNKKPNAVYVDLTYVPHHGNHYYSYVDFFKRIRARYYVFSGLEPSRQVYDALLEAKQTWDDKELEVTIIPTYDTDILGYWVAENEELLSKFKIDLAPSASRCTINLQDHETSCSAYRLEF